MPPSALAPPQASPARRRPGTDAFRLLPGAACLVVLIAAVTQLPAALRAAARHGVTGTFWLATRDCLLRLCSRYGPFPAGSGGSSLASVSFRGSVPAGGGKAAARHTGSHAFVYPVTGSMFWLVLLALAAVSLAVLGWAAYEPARQLRRAHSRAGRSASLAAPFVRPA